MNSNWRPKEAKHDTIKKSQMKSERNRKDSLKIPLKNPKAPNETFKNLWNHGKLIEDHQEVDENHPDIVENHGKIDDG